MQRLFVMFPDRAPGIGLLMLRLTLCAALWTLPGPAPAGSLAASIACAGLLLAGMWTPLAVLLSLTLLGLHPVTHAAWLPLPVAMLLLGPGAYSWDARRFGRRVLLKQPGPDAGPSPPKE